MLPSHGMINCNRCFNGENSEQVHKQWKLINNPGAWGSTNPEILVLGFSKGATQNAAMTNGGFDQVAFARIRHRLKEVLTLTKLMDADTDIEDLFQASENRFSFGSLLRCGLGMSVNDGASYATSGAIIAKSFKDPTTKNWLNNCANQHLENLPSNTRVVVMLGVAEAYIKNCFNLIKDVRGDAKRINEVAYQSGGVLFVHLAHPSQANGTFSAWCSDDDSKGQGYKRQRSCEAIEAIPL